MKGENSKRGIAINQNVHELRKTVLSRFATSTNTCNWFDQM